MDPLEFLARFGGYVREHRDEIMTAVVDRTYDSVPGYAAVPRDDFEAATRETLEFLAASYLERTMPAEEDWQVLDRETVRRRVRQGVRAKDWIAHAQHFRQVFLAAAGSFADEAGIDHGDVLAAIASLDEGAHAGTLFAAAEFDAAADELLRQDDAKRQEFIEGLLRGGLTPAGARSGAAALGLDPSALYRGVRIRPLRPGRADQLLRAALRAEPTVEPRGVWTVIEGDVCGISTEGAPAELGEAAAGVGPPVPLEAAGSSYAVASTALETAARFGMAGTYRIEDLGLLPMVLTGGRAGDRLVQRLVDDVEGSGPGGAALIETVAAYLDSGLQAGVTAKALHLHVNSVRKRLHRYEALTGARLSAVDDVAAVWWALKRRELDGRDAA